MGIRYYGWPLRTELDYAAAVKDPCSTRRIIDAREASHNPDNCTGLDKAHSTLFRYFTRAPDDDGADAFERCCPCVDDRQIGTFPRPGALLLHGDVSDRWSTDGWLPYWGIIRPEYVALAADDYATVDLYELRTTCGDYCSFQFSRFRDDIARFASEGAGFLYEIA